ncbi:pyruvate dehydrogenase multienzyme complex, E2 component dihydrolipoyl transacetylase [Malaciobacter marinus]|uniref:Acetyltransferase component of pyruvate dehydrogenase complex n=1 Tax=Malaciobacter marinus TaxID=505249 RepID=A0A347TLJ8_9BACT|nr:dihydrolipoyllysine-residue acetyltransferase [Malaciobacter marinus]AXX87476.1 pyruvate dehydrogenase multienzyme complex, E2 component dihydrolipoyl transacetylase [Malaciobacter marinus]PHO14438.1 dihydrolipoyllysine-residue acetyltransferase [Malaciobacter marinus]
MSIEEIKLPDVGGEEVEVIEVCVKSGDSIEEEEAIIVVETEKASMDIPANFGGTIESISVKAGDKLSEGDLVCTMKKEDSTQDEQPKEDTKEEPKEEVKQEETQKEEEPKEEKQEESQSVETSSVVEDIVVPDLGEDGEVDVIEISVSAGDEVEEEDGLITLETEKATMDVPSPAKGKIVELTVKAGDKVSTGTVIGKIEKTVEKTVASKPATKKETKEPTAKVEAEEVKEESKEQNSSSQTQAEPVKTTGKVYASPSVRRIAREFGVDLSKVSGTGRKNRILKEDVRLFIKSELSKPSSQSSGNADSGLGFDLPKLKPVDFSKFGEIETVEMTRIQKISGPSLHRNWLGIPHITQFDEADISELEEFRKAQNELLAKKENGVKISPLVFALKAVAKALELHPNFNSSLSPDGQSIILKKYINIAVAVDTPNGLVVPVLKDVDKKGIEELSLELKEISIKARDGKLKAQDMQGACFTISSLGGIGGTAFTPIINAPEVAILGLSKSEMKPKWDGEKFEPRLMLPLSLSYDHRVIDGADGARFTTTLSKLLSDIRLLLL